ncbi:MAG: hypothetical protein NTY12_02680 [Candidatus Falkowbacteria bacterium]|nr:hypothetical protein [Candidatus Falkowbacteria bacterium]
MAKKLANAVKVIGLLTILGAAISKLAPLLKTADPKIKRKFMSIMKLLIELKEEVMDLGTMAAKEIKKQK